ncbi:uncharacterized protein [Dermacentor andersoni]|uniref:uncharacterized protein isoform X2 n=1 Tax=Dermacentor andersoni TaxID=34620 RepID=UPI003B3A5BFC
MNVPSEVLQSNRYSTSQVFPIRSFLSKSPCDTRRLLLNFAKDEIIHCCLSTAMTRITVHNLPASVFVLFFRASGAAASRRLRTTRPWRKETEERPYPLRALGEKCGENDVGINLYSLGSYVLGYYRNVASSGIFYDIILGAESGVDMASDYMLFSVLQVPANPALSGPSPAQVVETLRKFLMLNAGTIVVCCAGHVAGAHFLSRNNRAFLQRAIGHIALAIVKGVILYQIYIFYQDCKTNPPTQGVIFVLNPFTRYPAVAVPGIPAAPAQVEMAPAQGQMAPAQGQMAPAQGQMVPAQGQMAPAQGQMAPSASRPS